MNCRSFEDPKLSSEEDREHTLLLYAALYNH